MPGPGKRQKAPRAWARLMERKRNKTKGSKKRAKRPSTGPSGGQGYSGWKGGPWGGNEGGRVETEDQRSKRKEKEDANVRGYVHGGRIKKQAGGKVFPGNWEKIGPARMADAAKDPQLMGSTGRRASGSRRKAGPGGYSAGGKVKKK